MTAIAWINLGLTLAEAAARGLAVAVEGRALVHQLVAEGRDPSPEEWARLNALSADLHARIQESGA